MSIEAFTGSVLQNCKTLIGELKKLGVENADDQIQYLEDYFVKEHERITRIEPERYEELRKEQRKINAIKEEKLELVKMKISLSHILCPACGRGVLRIVEREGVIATECKKCTLSREFKI